MEINIDGMTIAIENALPAEPAPAAAPAEPKKGSGAKTALKIGGGIVLLAGLGVAGYMLANNMSEQAAAGRLADAHDKAGLDQAEHIKEQARLQQAAADFKKAAAPKTNTADFLKNNVYGNERSGKKILQSGVAHTNAADYLQKNLYGDAASKRVINGVADRTKAAAAAAGKTMADVGKATGKDIANGAKKGFDYLNTTGKDAIYKAGSKAGNALKTAAKAATATNPTGLKSLSGRDR